MRTIFALGWLALVPCACSGRYEVGSAGDGVVGEAASGAAGTGASGGVSNTSGAAAGGGSGNVPPTGGISGSGSVAGAPSARCETEGPPPPLDGPLAEPALVWERVARLIDGEDSPPPSPLPAEASHDWVSNLVTQAFARSRSARAADGATELVRAWLFRSDDPAESTLDLNWGALLLEPKPVLETLMLEPVGEHGYGAFSEAAWLRRYGSISTRGSAILSRLFAVVVPLPPAGIMTPTQPSNDLTRRQELAIAVREPTCQACHVRIDPFGYPYGHFDELGEYQELDDGLPIDTTGSVLALSEELSFADVQELGAQVAVSCDARKGIVVALSRAALGLEGFSWDEQLDLVGPHEERLQRAFLHSAERTYEDAVRAYAESPLVLQR